MSAPKQVTERFAQHPRVLVVEDERRLRELLADVVRDMGFAASVAGTGEEALATLGREPHDIVVLDLHLPLMNGMELFERVRRQWPATQVIVLTAYGDLESARQAIRLDVVDFLSKPFHLRDVEVALDRARKRLAPPTGGLMSHTTETPHAGDASPPSSAPDADGPRTLAEIEKEKILEALARNGGNRTRTATELGISRRALHYRLKEYGVTRG